MNPYTQRVYQIELASAGSFGKPIEFLARDGRMATREAKRLLRVRRAEAAIVWLVIPGRRERHQVTRIDAARGGVA